MLKRSNVLFAQRSVLTIILSSIVTKFIFAQLTALIVSIRVMRSPFATTLLLDHKMLALFVYLLSLLHVLVDSRTIISV